MLNELKKRSVHVNFADEERLLDFLSQMCQEDLWLHADLKDFKVSYINPGTEPDYSIELAEKGQIEELYKYGGSVLTIGPHKYLMNDLAWFTLKDRAGISSKYYNHLLKQEKYEKVISLVNSTWEDYNGGSKVLIRGGYVLAAHSEKYGVLNQAHIFNACKDFIKANFPKAKFIRGSYGHEVTEITLALSEYKDNIVQAYTQAWTNAGYSEDALAASYPELKVSTSDTGIYCAAVTPQLDINGTVYPMGEKLVVKHWGKNNVSMITDKFPQAFAAIEKGANDIAELINTEIDYPVETLIRAADSAGLIKNAKKAVKAVLTNFKETLCFGDTFTAFELYSLLCEIGSSDELKRMSKAAQLKVSEGLFRLLTLDWKKLDATGLTEI